MSPMKHRINRIAPIVSRIFEPILVLPTLAFVGGVRAGLGQRELLFYALFLLCAILLPVGLFLLWRRNAKGIPWDMPERRTRIKPLLVLSGLTLVYFSVVPAFHNGILTRLFFLLTVWVIGFTVLTGRWKISGHTGCLALVVGLFVLWFGRTAWPLLLLVPLVGWARVSGKNHTVAEVISGVVYSWLFLLVFGAPQ